MRIRIRRRPGGAPIVRATTRVNAPPLAAAALVARIEGWPAWAPRVRAAERLAGAPPVVPAPRRRAVAPPPTASTRSRPRSKWTKGDSSSSGTARRSGSASGQGHRAGSRASAAASRSRRRPERGTTRVVYTHESDLGGRLPGWAEDGSNRRGPVGVLRGLQRALSPSRIRDRFHGSRSPSRVENVSRRQK
ncbi:MAG: hypothetical protein MZU79_06485 [Anaerotruncus sp.]|nr:hypothetical protein [Anaerotruncus sp.]